ncbi:MAG: hypothetical protein M1826_004328 [Phylliscum demangeonii]|nr:MAG: hypothetical protein M1826_004328 [Phylliscum demangeonii]
MDPASSTTVERTAPDEPPPPPAASPRARVWASLITSTDYLPGLLTLADSLARTGTRYRFVALYTPSFPASGHAALDQRAIPKRAVPALSPAAGQRDYHARHEPRFAETWTKLAVFGLQDAYERVGLLDSDMLVRGNMDELLADASLPLDGPAMAGRGRRVFASTHACVCNPMRRPHYPADWIPANCAYTAQHAHPEDAQTQGAPPTAGLGMCNSGLLVVVPSAPVFDLIRERIADPVAVARYDFPDQGLLSDLFRGRWVSVPYVFNALKTLRRPGVHDAIWRDDRVRNVHYILMPKPWRDRDGDGHEEEGEEGGGGRSGGGGGGGGGGGQYPDETHRWWWTANGQRRRDEMSRGIEDGW